MILKAEKSKLYLILVASAILLGACNKEWDKHYQNESAVTVNERLVDYIKAQPELSIFGKMLTITGYDTILNASQSYTVWAPNDSALANVSLTNTDSVRDIVENHITRFLYPTSGIKSMYIKMTNGKFVRFYNEGIDFRFADKLLVSSDVLTDNGIVHVIDGYVPFYNNILQYIQRIPGFDSLENYIETQHTKVFDPENSIEVGQNSSGNSVYDSVFIETNVLLDQIGALGSEDSIYTAILPDNTAWNEAYNRIKNYYVSSHKTNKAVIQHVYTQKTIVNDLVFRNRIANPNTFDSLISTSGNVFQSPGYLFGNEPFVEVSNGLVFKTSQLQVKPTDVWHKEIRVEAEKSTGRTESNANIYLRYSFGSLLNVSNKSYIQVEPTTTSSLSKVYVDFSIPYTLAAKYNIYCVFVPTSIVEPTNLKPCRALFYINYTNGSGALVDRQQLVVANNKTDPNGITKMLIASNFQFPVCDLTLDKIYTPTVKIRVQNDVSAKKADTDIYNRTMRIDCIILEPVAE